MMRYSHRHIMKIDERSTSGTQKPNLTTYEMSVKKVCKIQNDEFEITGQS